MRLLALILFFGVANAASIPGGLPITDPDPGSQQGPIITWESPEGVGHANLPIGDAQDFTLHIRNLFSPAGEVRIGELDVFASRIFITCIPRCDFDDVMEDPLIADVSVLTSLNAPTFDTNLLDGRISGTMTLPADGFWEFRVTADVPTFRSPGIYLGIPEPNSLTLVLLSCLWFRRATKKT